MMKRQYIGIGLAVLLTFVYAWYEAGRPKEVDWSRTYAREDKIPYGTYILYRSLPHLFPEAKVVTMNYSLFEELQQVENERNAVYFSVSSYFEIDGVELKRLLDWVGRGNSAFIAANHMADTLLSALGVERGYAGKSAGFKLLYGDLEAKIYPEDGNGSLYFRLPEDFAGEVLGKNERDSFPHFIRIPLDEGQLLLNVKPWLFTNHAVLDSVRGDYYYKALSVLPANTGKVIWDDYRTRSAMNMSLGNTPLRVILKYPALKLAWYLMLAGVLLYMFFRARREQRPVPVIAPPRNRMLEFVSTVSLLYYKKKEHVAVAMKRIDFFLDKVRTRYLLSVDMQDDRFVDLLAGRSGVDRKQIEALVQLIHRIKTRMQVSESELERLMKETEPFVGTNEE